MLEYILSETDRITRVKIALYNLDLWQIANRSFVIPESGFVRAEDGIRHIGVVWDLFKLGR